MTSPDEALDWHLDHLQEALAASDTAPLSVRKAMLVVMLADAFADRLSEQAGGDILEVRAGLTERSAELGLLLQVAALRDGGPRLAVEPVEVPIADFPTLSTADFMVSVYNGHAVDRLLIALPDGSHRDAHDVLHAAVAYCAADPRV